MKVKGIWNSQESIKQKIKKINLKPLGPTQVTLNQTLRKQRTQKHPTTTNIIYSKVVKNKRLVKNLSE